MALQCAVDGWPRDGEELREFADGIVAGGMHVELPALMTAGRWKSSKMAARYTERRAADRGAVARNYQEGGG